MNRGRELRTVSWQTDTEERILPGLWRMGPAGRFLPANTFVTTVFPVPDETDAAGLPLHPAPILHPARRALAGDIAMAVSIHDIMQMLVPQATPRDRIIVASGDEDFGSTDILDWISPLLSGLPGDSWSTCEFELAPGGMVQANYRDSRYPQEFKFETVWSEDESASFRNLLPCTTGLIIVAINDNASQVFALVDSVASWLSVFDPSQPELRPLLRILETLWRMAHIHG